MFELELADGRHLQYDPHAGRLAFADGGPVGLPVLPRVPLGPFSAAPRPSKSRRPRMITIQLGLACNKACPHCFQAGYSQATGGHPNDISPLLQAFRSKLQLGTGEGLTFDFRGGEPFAYAKTFLPLVDALRREYPAARMVTICNGTLLMPDIMAWARRNRVTISVSHDGPATMETRGFDPLDDLNVRELLRTALRNKTPAISFNVVLSVQCRSVEEAHTYIAGKLKIAPDLVRVTSEGFQNSYTGEAAQTAAAARQHWRENVALGTRTLVHGRDGSGAWKLGNFFRILIAGRPAASQSWGCGKADPDNLVVDMKGDVISCHNVTAADGHKLGTLDDLDAIEMPIPHWSAHPECMRCPVLRSCHGGCFVVDAAFRDAYCDDRFYSRLPILAAAVERLSGSALVAIRGENIRNRGEAEIRLDLL
jgi:uncharacterized protein